MTESDLALLICAGVAFIGILLIVLGLAVGRVWLGVTGFVVIMLAILAATILGVFYYTPPQPVPPASPNP